ncbi:MAG: hypothetical protein LBD98_01975 [Endomicrobium sp.]|jgi:hypothetical protein|nr:hypothetical protein [Endomicrobium sp.]
MEGKIPFYNLVNMLLIGVVFLSGCFIAFTNEMADFIISAYPLTTVLTGFNSTFVFSVLITALAYMVGLIINRFSSVVIEEILILCKIIPNHKKDYKNFNNCRKENAFLYTLSREYGLSRGNFTLWFLLAILFAFSTHYLLAIVSFCIAGIFIVSAVKFSNEIQNIVGDFQNSRIAKQ